MRTRKPAEPFAPKPKSRPKAKPGPKALPASPETATSRDSAFGKRSEVRDSHDRYANTEVEY